MKRIRFFSPNSIQRTLSPGVALSLIAASAFPSTSSANEISVIAQKKGSAEALGIQCADSASTETQGDQKCSKFRFLKLKRIGESNYKITESNVPPNRSFSTEGLQLIATSIEELSEYHGVKVEMLPLTIQTVGISGMSVSYSWLSYLALPVDILTSPIHLPVQAIRSRSEGKDREEQGKKVSQAILSRVKAHGGSTIGKGPSQLSAAQWDLVVKRIERCVDHSRWSTPVECSKESQD